MAAILAVLGDEADTDGVRAKLARWFWCGVFGELYGSSVETQFAKDVPEFLTWLDGGPEPTAIADANFAPERLLTLKTRNSAAYKGLYALLLKEGGLDLRSGETINQQSYFDEKIDIHHIFPQKWCQTNGIEPKRCDCIVNKTAISARTNRMIGGRRRAITSAGFRRGRGHTDENGLNPGIARDRTGLCFVPMTSWPSSRLEKKPCSTGWRLRWASRSPATSCSPRRTTRKTTRLRSEHEEEVVV